MVLLAGLRDAYIEISPEDNGPLGKNQVRLLDSLRLRRERQGCQVVGEEPRALVAQGT